MRTVKVSKTDLLDRVRANRKAHRAEFEKALEDYQAAVIKELEEWLDAARKRKNVMRTTRLRMPQDQTGDYDQVVDMLEMSIEDTIELTHQEFAQYVRDDWAWKDQFTQTMMSNRTYLES